MSVAPSGLKKSDNGEISALTKHIVAMWLPYKNAPPCCRIYLAAYLNGNRSLGRRRRPWIRKTAVIFRSLIQTALRPFLWVWQLLLLLQFMHANMPSSRLDVKMGPPTQELLQVSASFTLEEHNALIHEKNVADSWRPQFMTLCNSRF